MLFLISLDYPIDYYSVMVERRTFAEFFQHLNSLDFNPTAVIDVGAADGTPILYEAFPNATHYAFEPLPRFANSLRSRMRGLNHHIFEKGVLDKPGKTAIFLHQDLYGSSFMCKSPPDGQRLDIDVTTLDIALADFQLGNDALLKTDCQGADLLAIKGATEVLACCELVIMEASLFPFWGPHEPVLDEIILEMRQRGFKVYDFLDGLFRPSDNALGQVDVVFARENGKLRASHLW